MKKSAARRTQNQSPRVSPCVFSVSALTGVKPQDLKLFRARPRDSGAATAGTGQRAGLYAGGKPSGDSPSLLVRHTDQDTAIAELLPYLMHCRCCFF